MSLKLIETMEAALAGTVQAVEREASVMVQFAAGDWAAICEAVSGARERYQAEVEAVERAMRTEFEDRYNEAMAVMKADYEALANQAPSNTPEPTPPQVEPMVEDVSTDGGSDGARG